MAKTIRYNLTFLGMIEVPDNATDEEIREAIQRDYDFYSDFDCVNDVDYDEVEEFLT
jgi:hypothetical protein